MRLGVQLYFLRLKSLVKNKLMIFYQLRTPLKKLILLRCQGTISEFLHMLKSIMKICITSSLQKPCCSTLYESPQKSDNQKNLTINKLEKQAIIYIFSMKSRDIQQIAAKAFMNKANRIISFLPNLDCNFPMTNEEKKNTMVYVLY